MPSRNPVATHRAVDHNRAMTNFSGTIVTLGGGGFSQAGVVTPIDDHILHLTRVERPRVCFVPTASGDDLGYAEKFERAFAGRPETSVLSLFTKAANDTWTCDPRHVLSQDVVYVGGGSTANMLAVWRRHGLPELLRKAAASGTILAGISAGMNCWFEASSTDSFGPLAPLDDGLGFLPGSACPHLFGEPGRAENYRRWVADGALPDGHAVDDAVALVWSCDTEYGTFTYAVTEKPGGAAWRVTREQGEPHVIPTRLLNSTVAPRISEILYAANLLGLAESGAPSDEFDAEAEYIASGLPACTGPDDVLTLVHTTFVRCFDSDGDGESNGGDETSTFAGPRERYADVARQIWALRTSSPAGGSPRS